MKKIIIISAILIFAISLNITQAKSAKVNINVIHKKLKNGLNVYLSRIPTIPAVTVKVYYHVGSKDERDNERGLSHFLEHMMFKTTINLKSGEYSKLIKQNGGYSNANTSFDRTVYYCVLPKRALELGLKLEAERMVNLTIDEKEFKSEKQVVLEELRNRSENNPMGYFWTQFIQKVYEKSSYGKPVIGRKEQVKALTPKIMKQYYRRFYAPNNADLIVTGDIDISKTLKLIKKYFVGLKPQKIDRPGFTPEPKQKKEKRFVFKKHVQLPRGLIYFHGPKATDKDSSAMEVIELILFGGRSSRLVKKLVLQTGLSVGISGGQYLRIHNAPFAIIFAARDKKYLPLIEKEIYKELKKFKKGEIRDYEIYKARNKFISHYYSSLVKIKDVAETIGDGSYLGNYKFYLETRLNRIMNITKKDLIRVANKYFNKSNRNVGYLVKE